MMTLTRYLVYYHDENEQRTWLMFQSERDAKRFIEEELNPKDLDGFITCTEDGMALLNRTIEGLEKTINDVKNAVAKILG